MNLVLVLLRGIIKDLIADLILRMNTGVVSGQMLLPIHHHHHFTPTLVLALIVKELFNVFLEELQVYQVNASFTRTGT